MTSREILDGEEDWANDFTVVIRRPRVLRWCSRCFAPGFMTFYMWAWDRGFCVDTLAEMEGTRHS